MLAVARTSKTLLRDLGQPALPASFTETSGYFASQFLYRTRALAKPATTQPPPPSPPPQPPNLDFHQIISTLGDYPLILRRLGLIIDLEIPAASLGGVNTPEIRVQVSGNNLPQGVHPWTACVLSANGWVARSSSTAAGSLSGGVVDLKGVDDSHVLDALNPFEIVQIDPDGAGAKLLNLSAALTRGDLPGPIGQGTVGLPALRSAGLGVIKTDRHKDTETSINNAVAWSESADGSQTFFAEDLLRGYRVDILDETQGNTWRSLCQRVGVYKLRDGTILPNTPADEGYVKAASATSQSSATGHPEDADANSPLYMHESIFRWTNWSLCAGRPGRTITDQGTAAIANDAAPSNPTGLSVNFVPVPGSLPRLRFGHTYQIRVRAVDLTGGGLKLTDLPPSLTTDSNSVVYARFNPIPPPVVVLTDDLGEGESIERMAIRSNYNQTTTQYASNSALQTVLNGRPYNPTCDRHLVPPKCALEMAEAHGAMDSFIGAGASDQVCDAGYNLALREAGSVTDATIVNVSTGAPSIQVPGLRFIQTGSAGQIVIHPEAQMLTPYLPDPIARGVTLTGVPGAGPDLVGVVTQTVPANVAQSWGGTVPQNASDTVILQVPFSTTWPDTQSFRLRIAERSGTVPATAAGANPNDYDEVFSDTGQPQWDPDNHVLTVFLGKGQTATVSYSCYPDLADVLASQTPQAVPQLGYLHWWVNPNDASTPARTQQQIMALAQFIADGASWQVSPYRQLQLVYAVQQPLFAPAMVPVVARVPVVLGSGPDLRGSLET